MGPRQLGVTSEEADRPSKSKTTRLQRKLADKEKRGRPRSPELPVTQEAFLVPVLATRQSTLQALQQGGLESADGVDGDLDWVRKLESGHYPL